MRFVAVFALISLAACTAADVQPTAPAESASAAADWVYSEQIEGLRARSCPARTDFRRAEPLPIRVIEAERGSRSARTRLLSGLSLAGAWQLEADDSEFGGLSGLDVFASGSLLAITDDGKFVWIGIDPETGIPDGIGAMAYMRNAKGKLFPNKRAADSEGLVLRDGVAFVSFEQNHRIAAYDLESCGSKARAANVVRLDKVVDGRVLEDNRGPEALALSDQALAVGFEIHRKGGSPYGLVRTDGTLAALQRTAQPDGYLLTGMDVEGALSAKVFRAYDPARGPRVILQVDGPDGEIARATLKQPLPVDNFEGVAIGTNPQGTARIWLISDDNFSRNQRTLLLALDLTR